MNPKLKSISVPWQSIDTVLLDMDGTLLDLHFDNYFWMEYVPKCFAVRNGISVSQSKSQIAELYSHVMGTLEWYCLDYWSEKLKLDIPQLKLQIDHKIIFRPNAIAFLRYLVTLNKRVILATNAHPKTLELKLLKVDFKQYFDHLSSSHNIGYPKEERAYWEKMVDCFNLDASRCLFIDDSLSVLKAADDYGIAHVLGICKPDSEKESVECTPFTGIHDFSQLIYQ